METQFKRIDPSQYAHSWEDIPYANDDPLQKLSIYTPGDDGNYPLLVYVNGGGWVQQLVHHQTVPGAWMAPSQGYALASIGYRLAPKDHWPAQIHDVKAAIRFLRAHADEYGYNADKIIAWGNSAGGHILGMCCATNTLPTFEDLNMGNAEYSSSIQGLISFYAPSDLYQMELGSHISDEEMKELSESPVELTDKRDGMNKLENILLGCRALANPSVAALASPINFVTPDFPPVYFLHGLDDPIVPYTQSAAMYNMVRFVCGNDRAKIEMFPGAGHGDPAIKSDEVTKRIYDFADEIVFGYVRERPSLPELMLLDDPSQHDFFEA